MSNPPIASELSMNTPMRKLEPTETLPAVKGVGHCVLVAGAMQTIPVESAPCVGCVARGSVNSEPSSNSVTATILFIQISHLFLGKGSLWVYRKGGK